MLEMDAEIINNSLFKDSATLAANARKRPQEMGAKEGAHQHRER
jgi:hypothetical protein